MLCYIILSGFKVLFFHRLTGERLRRFFNARDYYASLKL